MSLKTHFACADRTSAMDFATDLGRIANSPVIDTLLQASCGLFAILNDKRQILALNQSFLEMVGIENAESVLGLRPGEYLGCIHADEMPGGCGTSSRCSECGAAIAILAALESDIPQEGSCELTVLREGLPVDLSFQVRCCRTTIDGENLLLMFLQDLTSLKEEANRELRTIIETARDGFLLLNTAGRLLDANQSYCSMSGYSRRELLAMTIWDLTSDEAGAAVNKRIEQGLQAGTVRFETQHRRKDGSIMELEAAGTCSPEMGDRIFSFYRDITDRKRAEEALRESEQRFRTIFENSGVGIFVADMQGHLVQCNPLLLKMLGYSETELRAMTFRDFTHPAERDLDWELYREIVEGRREQYQVEKRYLTKSGSLMWGRVTVSLVRDAAGGPSHSIRIVEDITERKLAELMLAESRAEFEAVLESTDDFIWSVDARHFGLLTFNSAIRNHFLANGQLALTKGMTPFEMMPSDVVALWSAFYQRALTEGSFTTEYCTKWGSVTLLLSFNPLRRGDEIYGISVFGKNIAKLKEAESALLHYQAQLNALASELSLAQERERRKIAYEIHDNVVQNLSLGKIMVSNSVRTGAPDKLEQVKGILDEAIRQMRSLIFDLSPPMLYEMGLVPVLEALGERLGQEHAFSFNLIDASKNPPLEESILVGVYQSVRELFMNVVKHARARNVTLHIESDAAHLRISLQDDGAGFEVENVLSKARQQHSIGLFGVQQRLRHLGGGFEMDSSPGEGARLELSVPLAKSILQEEVF